MIKKETISLYPDLWYEIIISKVTVALTSLDATVYRLDKDQACELLVAAYSLMRLVVR